MDGKQIRKSNEETAQKYGPRKFHPTKNIFIKFAENVKKIIIKKAKTSEILCNRISS